jgi:hypothetical protein
MMAGGEAVVKIVPEGAHGFIMSPEYCTPLLENEWRLSGNILDQS